MDEQNAAIAESGRQAGRNMRRRLAAEKKRTADNIRRNGQLTEQNLAPTARRSSRRIGRIAPGRRRPTGTRSSSPCPTPPSWA